MQAIIETAAAGTGWFILLAVSGLASVVQSLADLNGSLARALAALKDAIWPLR